VSPAPATGPWVGIAVLALAGVGAALVSQHVFDMQPCAWCVLQRLIFVLIAALALLGAVWRGRTGARVSGALVIATAASGVAAALWQHFVDSKSLSCDLTVAQKIMTATGADRLLPEVFEARAMCIDAKVDLLGVPYEFWSLALFVLLAIGAVAAMRRATAA
jgi:protein dithiol:quinone oxidoreductase